MKSTLFTLMIFFAFTAFASAQEEQDKTQRQPPVVTHDQVEKDAKLAQQERKKNETARKEVTEENKAVEDKRVTSGTDSSSSAKKASRPGKQ